MSKKKEQPLVEEAVEDLIEADPVISIDKSEGEVEEEVPVESDPIAILEKDLEQTKDELVKQNDKFARLQAETDNFRKRLSREKEEFSQYANERLFKALIPIFDNFERALEAPSNDAKSLKEGLDMILKQFGSFLGKEKVEPIKAIGEKFNPAFHEALTSEESVDHEEGIIISQFVKGYTINGRVLRPSQVVISKKPSPESKEGSKHESEEESDKEENPTD